MFLIKLRYQKGVYFLNREEEQEAETFLQYIALSRRNISNFLYHVIFANLWQVFNDVTTFPYFASFYVIFYNLFSCSLVIARVFKMIYDMCSCSVFINFIPCLVQPCHLLPTDKTIHWETLRKRTNQVVHGYYVFT